MKIARTLALSSLALLGLAAPAHAHEKWFQDTTGLPLRWDLYLRTLPLSFTGGVLILFAIMCLLWKLRRGRDLIPGPDYFGALPERRMAFYGLAPAILGLHVAVPLLVYGVLGQLFTPNNFMQPGWAHFLGLGEALIALCFLYGGMTRPAALALIGLWAAGAALFTPEPMLESLHILGFAGFFYLAGRGPISVDRLLFPKLEPPVDFVAMAPTVLRVGVGLSLATVGFTEKLANIPLAEAFLTQHPEINFTSKIGIGMSDELFALFAGSVELLAGLMIAFGVFPRTIILVALVPMNRSLTVFNWRELVGHMPFYGALAFLLVWTPKDRDLWVSGLRGGPLGLGESPNGPTI